MAEVEFTVRRGPSRVIQGSRERIAAELEKLGNDRRELTLIVPGEQMELSEATSRNKRAPFDSVFTALQKGFEESGMSDDEVGQFVDAEVEKYRAERQACEQP